MAFGDHKFGDGIGIQITLVTENRPNYLLWAKAMKDLRVYIFFFIRNEEKYINRGKDIGEKRDTSSDESTHATLLGKSKLGPMASKLKCILGNVQNKYPSSIHHLQSFCCHH